MKVNVEELPGSRKRMDVELEQEEVSKHFEDLVKRLVRDAQIPGFRKGKVPGHVLEKRMGKSLQAEVLEKIVGESYGEACREKDITPISEPSVDTGSAMPQKDKPYSFSVTVDTKPGVSIEDYKGLVLEKEKIEITDEHVSAALQQEREERAEFLPVSGRPVMKGDWVLLDGKSLLDGAVVQDFSDYMVQAGEGRLPKGMDEALVGCPVGQEKEISSVGKGGEQINYKFRIGELKKFAAMQVKQYLAIEEIAKMENITVTEEELGKVREQAAASGGQESAEEGSDDLRWSLRRKKTVDFLLSHAKIEDKGKSLIMTPDEVKLIDQGQKSG
jgi:trigger factor